MTTFSPVRGMADILPFEKNKEFPLTSQDYLALETLLADTSALYGYQNIRTPMMEHTELFTHNVGTETDIVGKEMFLLQNPEYCLRPEGTSGVLRAALSSGRVKQKLWYFGEMFRKERPQKGRYRQFTQFGMECFGYQDVIAEAQMLMICQDIWNKLGIADRISLQINSLGTAEERKTYKSALVSYFSQYQSLLSDEEKKRLKENPLRLLDSKNPTLQDCITDAPVLSDFLETPSLLKFEKWCNLLDDLGISYTVNPRLVRGLDYYNHSVFEWVTNELGAQSAVCGGGRYDGLMGMPYAVGFAMGIERLLLLIKQSQTQTLPVPVMDFYITHQGDKGLSHALIQSQKLSALGIKHELDYGGKLSDQMKRAAQSQARFAIICGEDEAGSDTVRIKILRTRAELVLPARDWKQINSLLESEKQNKF